MTRETACLAENLFPDGNPPEVSLVSLTLQRSSLTRKQLSCRLQQASASGSWPLVQRLHALLALAQGHNGHEVAARLALGEQTARDDRHAFRLHGLARLVSKAPPGRPSQRTQTQRPQRAEWITARPPACGAPSGGWKPPMLPDLIERRFGVTSPPHSLAT
jgi:transposase